MKLIVGLGNPGKEYVKTRHNLGFLSVDAFAKHEGAVWKSDTKRHAEIATATIEKTKVVLAKPDTYMNRSGQAVQAIASYYRIPEKNILIIHDDMDLEEGRTQFKAGGNAAGHNGIKDIQETLKTKSLERLRIGIGRPTPPIKPEDWVLGKLSPTYTPESIDIVAKMRDWIVYGIEIASNRWN